MIFFFTNFTILSSLAHKEMRFITCLVQIGQIAQAYMITWCFDCRDVLLRFMLIKGSTKKSNKYINFRYISGWMVKFFALFVVVKQEKGRIVRVITQNRFK